MASKRKSTTPCMVLASENDPDLEINSDAEEGAPPQLPSENAATVTAPESPLSEDDALDNDSDNQQGKTVEGGYECKYCSFQTPDLNNFTFHVDSEHPNVVLNSSYFCVECNFLTKRYDSLSEHNTKYHPGEDNFKLTMVKRNNQTIFEQTVNDLTFDGSFVQEENQEQQESSSPGISISKTPIMKIMKEKSEKKRITVSQNASDDGVEENGANAESEPKIKPQEEKESRPAPIISEPVKTNNIAVTSTQELPTAVLTPATVFQPGLAQVITTVQAQQNCNILSKVLIPINSIPSYNTALDSNPLLLNTYNKFPYPTVSEISFLAAQTKCTEEQIKIWFSAQRLKHGVSWTPEEVEDARRKQFNGTVHTMPQTITVIPAHISSAANGLPSILQTCQIVGQPSLVLTQLAGTNTLPPIALTVAGLTSNAHLQKAQLQVTQPVVEAKKVTAGPTPQITKQEPCFLGDALGLRSKKTKEQLGALKLSYLKNQFPHASEIERLMKMTGLTKGEIKKWFSDTRYNQRNSKGSHGIHFTSDPSGTIIIDSSDETTESPTMLTPQRSRQTWNPFPDFTPQKFKEKTVEQLHTLEESFLKSTVPSDDELNKLRVLTKLTRREIDAWFTERRRSKGLKDDTGDLNESKEGMTVKEEADENSPENESSVNKSGTSLSGKFVKKTPEQLHMLKSAFVRSQWPSPAEYDKLAEETGLARTDIVGWFGDTRYASKHNNLKWVYQYQENTPHVVNGQSFSRRRGRGRPRGRGRGRPRGRPKGPRRSNTWDRTTVAIKYKSGKALLKDYYITHKFLNEEDLDELVAKSQMGYEQVREWFAERLQREDAGLDPFVEEEEDDDNQLDEPEEEEENEETDDSDTWEPPKHVKRKLSKMED
ncbi:zinc fingers and homeoboxes protein 1 [Pelodytes ibericus]